MQEHSSNYDEFSYRQQVNTVRRLLDGLVIYRSELGETGRELEYLLRLCDIRETLDAPYSKCIH